MMKIELKKVEKKALPFGWVFQDKFRGYVAIFLYKIGFTPKVTYPFDDEFPIYGYGNDNYYCGIFQFTIPVNFKVKHFKKRNNG